MKFYISFGQTHTHSINGITIDKDCLVEIEAATRDRAREAAFSIFRGGNFSNVLVDPDFSFYPRGVVKL